MKRLTATILISAALGVLAACPFAPNGGVGFISGDTSGGDGNFNGFDPNINVSDRDADIDADDVDRGGPPMTNPNQNDGADILFNDNAFVGNSNAFPLNDNAGNVNNDDGGDVFDNDNGDIFDDDGDIFDD